MSPPPVRKIMGFYNRVRYIHAVSLNASVGVFNIIFKWQGSVFRLLWIDLTMFMLLYGLICLLYRVVLLHDPTHKHNFDTIVSYLRKLSGLIPLSFLLGFFVSSILNRWWTIINTVPWMPSIAFPLQAYLQPPTTRKCDQTPEIQLTQRRLRDLRVTVIRYMNMAWLLQLGRLSRQLRTRFGPPQATTYCICFLINTFGYKKTPCRHSLIHSNADIEPSNETCEQPYCVRSYVERVNADPVVKKFFNPMITPEELAVFESRERDCLRSSKGVNYKPEFWLPIVWSSRLLSQAREMKLIRDDRHFDSLMQMLERFRYIMVQLGVYNDFNIPLSYTQVVVFAVYSYFLSELFAQQYIDEASGFQFDIYVPLLSVMKFLFYIGWFKLGLSLINPLSGQQKCEFPMSDMLNFNLQASSTCAASDDFIYPKFMGSESGAPEDMVDGLHGLSKLKFDKTSKEEIRKLYYNMDNNETTVLI